MKPRLLNGCAKSKFIADAFEAKGWEAWTCDILPAEGPGNHIQDDVLKHLDGCPCYQCGGMGWIKIPPRHNDWAYERLDCPICGGKGILPWDMAIFHPPCTHLTRAGLRWLYSEKGRMDYVKQAADFFNILLNAPIPQIAIENPMQHRFARQYIRKYDQIIEPFMFGHREHKRTCLWLKSLPFLNPTEALWNPEPVRFIDKRGGKHYSCDMHPPSLERSVNRSRAFPGIAQAMADQWGNLGVLA